MAGCRRTAPPPSTPPAAPSQRPAGPETSGRAAGRWQLGSGHYPTPVVGTWRGCGPEGNGGDPQLNRLKNRTDEGEYQPVTLQQLLALKWPRGIERRDHDRWAREDAAEVARYEGAPAAVEAYLYGAKLMGPESCNCDLKDPEARDFHLWITESAGMGRENSMVVEMAPRVRDGKPGWTVANLNQIAQDGRRVRVSGWLMLDPEHPEQLGNTRGTLWEIHPIMRLEYEENGRWIDLATGQPSSAQSTLAVPRSGGSPSLPERGRSRGEERPTGSAGDRVWVNLRSGVYHQPGSPAYGRTKQGEYMTEAEARARGYRPAGGQR
jgi:hypothetical protein